MNEIITSLVCLAFGLFFGYHIGLVSGEYRHWEQGYEQGRLDAEKQMKELANP